MRPLAYRDDRVRSRVHFKHSQLLALVGALSGPRTTLQGLLRAPAHGRRQRSQHRAYLLGVPDLGDRLIRRAHGYGPARVHATYAQTALGRVPEQVLLRARIQISAVQL